jgi:hypothetical protein
VTLFPVIDEPVGIDDVDVWLLLGDERRFDVNGDWVTFDIERVGIILRLATVGTGETGNSEMDDVELVIAAVCCVRVGIDGGTTPVFVVAFELFFDDDGAGIIVGRRIPPVVDTDGFSVLDGGGGGSFTGRGTWGTVDGNWRDLGWDFGTNSVTSPSGNATSKNEDIRIKRKRMNYYYSLLSVVAFSLWLINQFHFVIV